MTDLNVPIYQLLKGVARVELEFPDATITEPVITITEITNTCNMEVDGVERLTDNTYQIDVWCHDRAQCEQLAGQVSGIMTANCFTRVQGRGFKDPSGLQRKMMYFKTISIN